MTDAPLPDSRALHRLEQWALLYLMVPVAIFLIGWLKWPVAVCCCALLLLACRPLWPLLTVRSAPLVPRRLSNTQLAMLALFGVAAVWVSLSGLAGGLTLNKDWTVRISVLRDLVVGDWPVSYGPAPGDPKHELILRFPMAYYMVPALAGKLAGWQMARATLWLWTVVGTGLFLALIQAALPARTTLPQRTLATVIAVVFSGMDVVGNAITWGELPSFGQHIEWWAMGAYQYSSQTTLLFWVPNHALPGWIAALILWRHRQEGLSVLCAGLLMLGLLAWAPLVAVGAAPLMATSCWRAYASLRQLTRQVLQPSVLAMLPLVWLTMAFETVGGTHSVHAINPDDLTGLLLNFGFFAILEWGIVALLVWRLGKGNWLLKAACVELLLLPLLRFGPGNDIVMRGGIPALTIVLLAAIEALCQTTNAPPIWRRALLTCLLIGGVTPVLEIERGLLPPVKPAPDLQFNFVEMNGLPWHYVGALNATGLALVLRSPNPIKVSSGPL